MDFNTFLQLAISVLLGGLCFFLKRHISKTDEMFVKCEKRINDVEKELHALKEDMPFVYTTREDFLRIMNNVDDKLNRILYGKNGGTPGA